MAARLLKSHAGLSGQRFARFTLLALVIFCLCFTISTKPAAAQTLPQTSTITASPSENVTENVTEKVTENVTEHTTEKVTENVTEHMTEKVTENVTEDVTEIITEIVTEFVEEEETTAPSTTLDTNEEVTDEETTPDLLITDLPGETLVVRFTISNRNYSDLEDPDKKKELETLLVDEFKVLYSDDDKFKSATVLEFRNGSIIADVQLEFTDALNVEERAEVLTTLFAKIVLNGTLGALEVQDLKQLLKNDEVEDLNDACDVRPCLMPDLTCVAKGTKCTANCNDNKGYCLEESVCQPNNDYILCVCKKGFYGSRCDIKPAPPSGGREDNAYIGIIVAAGIAVVLLLVMIIGCGYSRLANRGKESDTSKLFHAENSVALEMLDEPPPIVGGVACQTIESFLLAKYMKHGIPPKPGFKHETIQTNESFLLDKAQRERESTTNNIPAGVTPNGSGASPPPAPAPTPVSSSVPEDQPITEPEEGISNKAFVEDEGDIVPTAEIAGEEGKTDIGKKIIKV